MKRKIILICITVVLLLGLFGCGGGGVKNYKYSCGELYSIAFVTKTIELTVGDTFTVTLCSDPETGFEWPETADISDPTVVAQVGRDFVLQEDPISVKRALGDIVERAQDIFTFTALKAGTTTLELKYSQPEEGGVKGAWEFYLNITVIESQEGQ